MNNIDKIAEAMNAGLRARPQNVDMHTPATTPAVVLRTLARMGWRLHKYPAPDTYSADGVPAWSLDAGSVYLPDGRVHLGVRHEAGDFSTTLDEWQQFAEGILGAVELARTLTTDNPESKD